MKLYDAPGACSLAPHIVAQEAGIPLELVKVDLNAKKTADGADYLAINPRGYVPALQLDDGEVLTEVAVILQYLADLEPESGLMPAAGTMARYRQLEALSFAATEVHKQIGMLFDPALTPEMQAVQRRTVARRLDALNAMLEGKPFVTGERFTAADAYLYTALNWTVFLGIDLAPWRNILGFMARVAQRPQVMAALKAEGLVP